MGRLRTVVAVLVCVLAALAAAEPAGAQDDAPSIRGTLRSIDGPDRTPVPGVAVVVTVDGAEVGRAESDADGEWEVAVPSEGTYTVALDTSTLPEDVALTDPARVQLDAVDVRPGQRKTVAFPLGPGISTDDGTLARLADLAFLGLKLGAIIALSSIGLSLVFGVTGLVNFAHGELITMGAVLAYLFHVSPVGPQLALLLAAVPAVVLVAASGGVQERLIWRPLRAVRAGNIAMLVISIGLSFAIRNVILIIFSGEPRSFDDYAVQREIDVLGVSTVPKNVVIVLASVAILVAVGLFLQKTRTGIAMRAVADSRDLSESSGIDVQRVVLVTWILGAGLAGLGGVFFGVSEQITWDMGFRLLLLVFAAVVLGGLGTAYGAMVGGFVIGVAVEMSTFVIDTELKNAVALGVLVVMLLVRPQGLLGTRERIG